MNSFGLGLVLNFTDNASSGMRRVSQTFKEMNGLADSLVDSSNSAVYSIQSLTATGIGLSIVGENLSDVGNSITSLFAGISQSVLDTGMTMQGFRMQLSALYGEDSYEQKIQEIKQYAKDSVFEVEGLMSAITVMKAVGIEAMDEVTSSSGNTTQRLMDYASDIAAMVPNMRNAYGTGVNAAMGALKEYIAEGNELSLKRGAGFDLTGILGVDKGATIEERTQQVADLVEALGIAGYTASLVGTPTQQLAKIQDTLFNVMSDISDSGVFDTYTRLLTKAATWIDNLTNDTEKYNTIVSILSDTIVTIISPLEYLLDLVIRIADAFLKWIEVHPALAKGVLISVAAIGAFLIVAGQALKLAGGFFLLTSSITQMGMLAKNGVSLFNVFGKSIGLVLAKLTPFIAFAALAYLAWKNNLFGIRDTVTQVFKELSTVFTLTFDALGDNALSEEDYLRAKDLGILPFIESLLDLKYLFGVFTDSFHTGFQKVFDTIDTFSVKIAPVNGLVFNLTNSVGNFLKRIFNVQTNSDAWSKLGEAFGVIVGVLTVAIPLIMGAVKAFKLIGGVITLLTSPVGLVVLAIAAVVAAIAGLKYAWDNNLGGIQEKTRLVLESILGFYNTYLAPFVAKIVTFVGTIVTLVRNLWESWLKPVFLQIGSFLGRLWTNSLQPLLQKLGTFFGAVIRYASMSINLLINLLFGLWNNVLSPIVNWLVTVLSPTVNNIVQVVLGIIEFVAITISDVVSGLLTILGGFLDFVTGVFTGDWELAWQGICDIFGGIWETLVGIVKGVVNAVILVINTLFSTLYSGIAGVVNGIGSIFGTIASALGFEDMEFSIPDTAPQIPYLAEGGVATESTHVVVGDGEENEAILPLNSKVFSEIAKGISKQQPIPSQPIQNDYSVTFSAGSIVIQLTNATEAELEKAAEKLMKIIERKQQLKAMAVRT